MAAIPGSPLSNVLFPVIEFAAGTAMGPALSPVVQDLTNFAWSEHPVRPLAPEELAQFVARGIPTTQDLHLWAARSGIDKDRFDDLVQLFRSYPDLGTLLQLWRRIPSLRPDVPGALNRQGYSDAWTAHLLTLVDERLAPAQIALGIVRSIIADPGLMPVQLDTSGGVVKPYPVSNIDALTEAYDAGIDKERLRVLVGEIGLPMSAQQAASARFRKIIEKPDYYRAILEGDTRPEWADAIYEQARQIPTAHDFVEERLRGWVEDPAMYAGTARHGMTTDDTDVLFKISGRPLSFRQVFIGERRGGAYGENNVGIDPAFLKSLQESNIRPEWYQLAWAQRHSYPSAFVLRALVQAGDLTADEGYDILLRIGWVEALARKIADRWASGGAKAQAEQTKGELITEYEGGFLDEAGLRSALGLLGWTGGELDREVHLADARRVKAQRDAALTWLRKLYVEKGKLDDTTGPQRLAQLGIVQQAIDQIMFLWRLEKEAAA